MSLNMFHAKNSCNPCTGEMNKSRSAKIIFFFVAGALLFGLFYSIIFWFVSARSSTASNACVMNLRNIANTKNMWRIEYNKDIEDVPTWDDLFYFMGKDDIIPVCPENGIYTIGRINEQPTCSVGGRDHTISFYGER